MSCAAGPDIVESGLVLAYDMNNTGRSFMGAPTTNLLPEALDFVSGNWTKEGGFGTVTPNYTTAPDGTLTAARLFINGI